MEPLSEKDWRDFKALKADALERYCAAILAELASLSADMDRSAHERYLAVYTLIHKRNRSMAKAFDGHSRSKARHQLRTMHTMGLITDQDLQRFGLCQLD